MIRHDFIHGDIEEVKGGGRGVLHFSIFKGG
jgi:hypothetical protein